MEKLIREILASTRVHEFEIKDDAKTVIGDLRALKKDLTPVFEVMDDDGNVGIENECTSVKVVTDEPMDVEGVYLALLEEAKIEQFVEFKVVHKEYRLNVLKHKENKDGTEHTFSLCYQLFKS